MRILGGTASTKLSEELCSIMGGKPVERLIKRFPDGEVYVRIMEDIKGEDVAIIQTTYPDENIIELFAIQDAARDEGAARIITVVPYFGYSRQDKKFQPGEAITARAMMKHLQVYSDALVFVDLHAPKIMEWADVKTREVHASSAIGDYIKGIGLDIDFVLSPDKGAIERASRVANELGVDFDYLQKTRIDGNTVKMAPKNLDVNGKSVLIVDDIIATGGTIVKATEQLKENGARAIYAACTHGLYTGNAVPRLKAVLDGVFSSDTIESETSVYSAAAPIASALKEL